MNLRPFAAMWMELEGIFQTELNQENEKHQMVSLISGLQRSQTKDQKKDSYKTEAEKQTTDWRHPGEEEKGERKRGEQVGGVLDAVWWGTVGTLVWEIYEHT